MDKSEIQSISWDLSNLLNTLLMYRVISKTLQKNEINIILDEGSRAIMNHAALSKIDGDTIQKILSDVKANISDAIMMNGNSK